MICFLHPENLVLTSPAEDLAKQHAQHTNGLILDALIERFGDLPPLDQIAKHVVCVYDENHTAHYVWLEDPDIKVGAQIDMSNLLVSIAPPKPYEPEN
jgi:hypothetical protein